MTHHDNTEFVRGMYEDFNNRNFDHAMTRVANDCEWRDLPTGQVFRGPSEFKRSMQIWANEFPDAKIEVTNIQCSGDWCTVEFTGRGTNTGPLTGPTGQVPATGRRIDMQFCEVFEVKNGKITRGRTYWDMATMMTQLGLTQQTRQASQ